jgi:hypothetical protein
MHNNFKDILDFVRCIKIFDNTFDESRICSLAQEALINGRLRLNSAEYLILSWINYVPLKAIQKYKKIHKLALGREINHYMSNPDDYYFYPQNSEEDVLEMQKFLNAVEKMRGVGITWTIKFTKKCGHYSNLSDPKLSL